HPPESALLVPLQRDRGAGRGWRALPCRGPPALADARWCGDGAILVRRCGERASTECGTLMNIGQASEASRVSQRMIRHYEKIALIPVPLRRASGYRVYSEADVARLQFVAHARDLGFPIEEIRSLLGLWQDRERSSADVKALAIKRA